MRDDKENLKKAIVKGGRHRPVVGVGHRATFFPLVHAFATIKSVKPGAGVEPAYRRKTMQCFAALAPRLGARVDVEPIACFVALAPGLGATEGRPIGIKVKLVDGWNRRGSRSASDVFRRRCVRPVANKSPGQRLSLNRSQ